MGGSEILLCTAYFLTRVFVQHIFFLAETNTKPQRRKFGLAWLFSYQEDEENDKAKSQQYPDIDKRIRGTWMTLEATKKEQRLEVKGNGQYSRWKSIDWNNRNCSQIPKLSSITRSKHVIVTPTDKK